jgi:hypothetical protein
LHPARRVPRIAFHGFQADDNAYLWLEAACGFLLEAA